MTTQSTVVPKHIGFIVDGNRRYARAHGLPSAAGHAAGYKALKKVVLAAVDKGVQFVSIYVFSTENWSRSKEEVGYLMKMTLQAFKNDADELMQNGIRVRVLGTREGVDPHILQAIDSIEAKTAAMTRGTVAVCFNYGGRREIVDAVRASLEAGVKPGEITEQTIRDHLYCPEVPDVDMVVRTSAEQRISNFMLWRVAYAELMFLEKLWPEMQPKDIDDIIAEYNRRNRRFGGN